jgi:hypothetical protein
LERRGGRGAAGVVSKSREACLYARVAILILLEITNHYYCFALSGSRFAPVCAAKERDLFINGAVLPP